MSEGDGRKGSRWGSGLQSHRAGPYKLAVGEGNVPESRSQSGVTVSGGKAGMGAVGSSGPMREGGDAGAHYERGNRLLVAGELEEAVISYRRAVELKPGLIEAHGNLGVALQALGRLEEAAESFRRVLSLDPRLADTHYNLGEVLRMQGKLEESSRSYEQALLHRRDFGEAYNGLGMVLQERGEMEMAVGNYRKAIAAGPRIAESHYNLGRALQISGLLGEATAAFRKALAIKPAYAEAYNNLGSVFLDQGRLEEAITHYRKALVINPRLVGAYYSLGDVLRMQGRWDESIASYRQAILMEAYIHIGNIFQEQSRQDEAIASYRAALAIKPDCVEAYSNLLMAMQYTSAYSPSEKFAEHLRFAEKFEAPLKPFWPAHQNVRDPSKRLKIGYVSGDFFKHSMGYFIEPILASHDRSQVEVFCYYNNTLHDSGTDRIIAVTDHWMPCVKLSDEQLAEQIHSDGIDILVDLSGHTALNRLLTFARKPAPIQVTWMGYSDTTGLAAMDYLITDIYLNPPEMTEKFFSEKLLRLPRYRTFQPAAESPPVNELPALSNGHFTLACLNNLVKINQEAVHLWAQILVALPHARIVLGNATSAATRERLIGMFAQEGISSERLVLHPKKSLVDYLALHHQIDLALDTIPFGGGTSSFHSLWMGVPVINLAGHDANSRTGVEIMAGIGLPEFVAESEGEYVARTLEFARDLPRLNQIRLSLRERMAEQGATDPARMTRGLELAFRNIWETWCGSGSH
ncbi:MAG: tetratricopeptide repeat protein [Gammaproteobacteria bacterium]|nr:tetratricopeptide repeat protein [Gammaproteobacteria bacterium]